MANTRRWFSEKLEHLASDPEYLTEQLLLDINEEFCRLLDEQAVSRADLARRLGVHRQFVTKLLNGTPNVTLATLVKVATALDTRIKMRFVPHEEQAFGNIIKFPRAFNSLDEQPDKWANDVYSMLQAKEGDCASPVAA